MFLIFPATYLLLKYYAGNNILGCLTKYPARELAKLDRHIIKRPERQLWFFMIWLVKFVKLVRLATLLKLVSLVICCQNVSKFKTYHNFTKCLEVGILKVGESNIWIIVYCVMCFFVVFWFLRLSFSLFPHVHKKPHNTRQHLYHMFVRMHACPFMCVYILSNRRTLYFKTLQQAFNGRFLVSLCRLF